MNRSAPNQSRHEAGPVRTTAADNAAAIRGILSNPGDLIVKELAVGASGQRVYVLCIDGLVDRTVVDERIFRALLKRAPMEDRAFANPDIAAWLADSVLPLQALQIYEELGEAIEAMLGGDALLFIDGSGKALAISSRGWKSRGIEEPQTEALIRGPREGFTEDIRTNTSLVRRRIRDTNLRFVSFTVGRKELKKDAIGLERYLYENRYRTWTRIKDDWDHGKNLFSAATIRVEASASIRRSGNIDEVRGR